MTQVNMHEAKTNLSKLIQMLEEGEEDVIYIARNGVSAAQITLVPKVDVSKRIGIAKGQIKVSEDFDSIFDSLDDTIAELFEDGGEL